jgi:hypothetical protein
MHVSIEGDEKRVAVVHIREEKGRKMALEEVDLHD